MLRAVNNTYAKKELSITQKQGIITIIPKGNKPRELLKNWRPISLLNVSYKIISGAIAKRIKFVLPYIIHENQKGFLSLMYDIIHCCNEKKLPGIILMIDFEKAFDTISWRFF